MVRCCILSFLCLVALSSCDAKRNYDLAVDSGKTVIAVARHMENLGGCSHKISFYLQGPQVWTSVSVYDDQVQIRYQCKIKLNAEKNKVISFSEEVLFADIIGHMDARSMTFLSSYEIDKNLWDKFIQANGDLSIILDNAPEGPDKDGWYDAASSD